MNIARFRHSAEAAVAVLLISGAGIAFAGNSSPAAPAAAAPAVAPAVAPTSEPVEAVDPNEPAEPAGVDTDTLQQGDQTQEGDQTTPDVAPVAPAAAKVAPAAVQAVAPAAVKAAAPKAAAKATETTGEAAGTETTGPEEPGDANLPGGGHADDPNDPNADHQFEGVE